MTITASFRGQDSSDSWDTALVISALEAGGAQRVVSLLANSWANTTTRAGVITFADERHDFHKLDPRVPRRVLGLFLPSNSWRDVLRFNFQRIRELRRALRELKPKTVVSFVAATNILTIIASTGLGIRVAISERNDPARQSLGGPWDVLRKLLYRRADVVTAIDESALETMSAYVPRRKLVAIPLAISPPPDGETGAILPDKPYVLAVGRLHPQKGHDVLIKAFALATRSLPDWTLVVAGEGELREELESLSNNLGISDRVRWMGLVEDPYFLYRHAEIFAMPSRYEGLGNALIEAMGCSLPPIVTDASPGPLRYVEDGITGLVVPVDEEVALAGAIVSLAQDHELRRALGENAARRVESHTLERILPLWNRLIDPSLS